MWQLYSRMVRKDVARSKLVTLATMLFVAATAMLVTLSAILAVNLLGSIDALMTKAQTPHFMQMHTGSVDMERLAAFASQNDSVTAYQVLEFLNIDNTEIVMDGTSLSGSVQDNGLSIQSGQFDYLLDLQGEIINVRDGEIYVPIAYGKEGLAKTGGVLIIHGKPFTIAGFLRDSQMNSSLSSSKRFLVSKSGQVIR